MSSRPRGALVESSEDRDPRVQTWMASNPVLERSGRADVRIHLRGGRSDTQAPDGSVPSLKPARFKRRRRTAPPCGESAAAVRDRCGCGRMRRAGSAVSITTLARPGRRSRSFPSRPSTATSRFRSRSSRICATARKRLLRAVDHPAVRVSTTWAIAVIPSGRARVKFTLVNRAGGENPSLGLEDRSSLRRIGPNIRFRLSLAQMEMGRLSERGRDPGDCGPYAEASAGEVEMIRPFPDGGQNPFWIECDCAVFAGRGRTSAGRRSAVSRLRRQRHHRSQKRAEREALPDQLRHEHRFFSPIRHRRHPSR